MAFCPPFLGFFVVCFSSLDCAFVVIVSCRLSVMLATLTIFYCWVVDAISWLSVAFFGACVYVTIEPACMLLIAWPSLLSKLRVPLFICKPVI